MSASTYFKMELKTLHSKPMAELENLLYSEWDVWNVLILGEKFIKIEDTESDDPEDDNNLFRKIDFDKESHYHLSFQVVIYELDKYESKSIIKRILKKAEHLNINLEIGLLERKT